MTRFLIQLFIKNKEDVHHPEVRKQYGTLAGVTGILCNLFLFLSKVIAGWLTNSISITADAFNNLSDACSSIMTLVGFRMSVKPADLNHPYGHGRIEYISGLFVSVVIVLMGFELFMSSVDKLFHPEAVQFEIVSVVILLMSIGIKFWMAGFQEELSKILKSSSMKAASIDSLSDCIATGSVLAGLVLSHFTGYNMDGILGIGVSCFILFAGYNAAKDTIAPLLGQTPDPHFVNQLSILLSSRKEMIGYHDLIIHDYGPGRVMVTVHGEVAYPIDIMEAHNIIDEIENEIKKELGCNISIHMDPVIVDDEKINEMRNYCKDILADIDEHFSLHDFRMIQGRKKSKLIFDVDVPLDHKMSKEELLNQMNRKLSIKYPDCYAVIEVDYGFIP